MKDKKKGCMYGLAIGDALGAAVEFMGQGTFDPVTDYRDGGPHGIEAGMWTDDTSMALALADSIAQGWDLDDQAKRYIEWKNEGKYSVNDICFDIGNQTWRSLSYYEANGEITDDNEEASSGNGSIMRLAPVVIRYVGKPYLPHAAAESSLVTHPSRLCVSSCIFLAEFLGALMESNETRVKVLADVLKNIQPLEKKVMDAVKGYDEGKAEGSGYVVDSLKTALRVFMNATSFEDAVLRAVNIGNDADTTGAITGQMAGAYWGYEAIPANLIEGLARTDLIDTYLDPIL
jgi:ADP-ribosyl-[dinitrogen reductase] hydrolase